MTAETVPREVARLRMEIEVVDRSIVALLGARERAQHRLLAWKEAAGLAGTDLAQEGRVLSRAADWARVTGTPGALATEVIRLALESGKRSYVERRTRSRPSATARVPAPAARPPLVPASPRVNSG